MGQLPAGTVTFLFTDIEGSTRLWEDQADAMSAALALHDSLLHDAVEAAGGHVVKTTGDGLLAAFGSPADAVVAAVNGQRALDRGEWGSTGALRVRMGLHTGNAEARDGDYFGPTLNRAARLMAVGHGGQVLVSQATASLLDGSSPAGVALRDLGEHRLRDLSQVERVYQVVATGLVDDFAPLRSLDAYSTNLPSQLTSFVGRDDEITALTTLLRTHRLVTLTGVGGVGKTRLALRVAAEVLPEARDGVWSCELAAADAEEAVLEIVTRALGVVPRPGMSARDSILDHLRGRECVIVLDNCEHVLDIAADLAEAILRGCEHVRVLATSREGLGVDGEQLRPIRSLPVPEATTAAAAMSTDATTLFAERATAVAPGFRIDDANAAAVVEICRRLDGIPLAIELAAARVASIQPAEIAELLDERFRLLTGSRRRGIERHQTLRATVDWSYSLLSDMERTVFDRLGVFVGSFDAPAAEAVVADDAIGRFDVLDALGELVAKSMLVAEPTPDGTTRYQLLETLRQYALERLEQSGEVDRFRRRHAEHYVTVTADLAPALHGPDEVRARARLDRETDNLRAAVDWSIDTGAAEIVRALITPIARQAAWSRGSEIGGWAERALTLMGDDPTPWQWLRAATCHKAFFADADSTEALRIADSVLEDPQLPAGLRIECQIQRAINLGAMGDVDACIDVLDDTWKWSTADPAVEPLDASAIAAPANLAIYLGVTGQGGRAQIPAQDALRRAQELGGPSVLALAHFALGYACIDIDPVAATASFERALRFSDAGAANIVRDRTMQVLAMLAWRAGDTSAAAHHLAGALGEAFSMGDYSSGGHMLELAVPVLGAGERWHAVLAVDAALSDGTLPAPAFSLDDVAEARQRAVTAARAASGGVISNRDDAHDDRDVILRYAIAELESLAAG